MRRPPLLYAGVCLALAVAVYVVAFDAARGRSWDAHVLHAATADRSIPSVRSASATLIDTIDIGSLILLGGGIVAAALLLGRVRAAIEAALVIVFANASTQVLKPLLGHVEPFGRRGELGSSFPSGHSTVAMSIALAAVLAAPTAWKLVVSFAGAAYAAGVGISLLVQASHYPSDVAGAFLLTGAWAGAIAALFPHRPQPPEPRAIRAGFVAAGAAAVAFAIAVAVVVETHPGIVLRIHVQTRLVFAFTVLAAIAVAVAAGLALVVQATALRRASTTRSWSSGSISE